MKLIIIEDSEESRLLKKNFEHYLSFRGKTEGLQINIAEIRDAIAYAESEDECFYVFHSKQRRKEIIRKAGLLEKYVSLNKIFVASIELMYANWELIDEEKLLIPINIFDYMDTILISVCEHCNLNCKGCSHFSSLVEDEHYLDYEQYCRDLSRIKVMINHTNRINFLGGEPLLHKKLPDFIKYARDIYPYAEINLVTNGILLRHIPKELKSIILETNTKILLSLYPPFEVYRKSTENFLQLEKLPYRLLPMTGFAPMLQESYEVFPEKTNEIICSNNVMLQDGYLARCPMYMTVKYYNERFNENYPYKDGLLNIYTEGLNANAIHEFLYKPHELCHYCARYKMPNAGMKEWKCYKKEEAPVKEDWL